MNELNIEFLKLLLISSNYKLKKSGTLFALYFFGQIDQIINSHTFYILEIVRTSDVLFSEFPSNN
jgi:hypothetical protein